MTAATTSFSYTVVDGNDAASVAKAFVNLIHAQMVDDGFADSAAFGAWVTASGTSEINFTSQRRLRLPRSRSVLSTGQRL